MAAPAPAPQRVLTVVHFNDVYNLEESEIEPVGGAARFVSAVKQYADRKPLIVFSGDSLSPSSFGQSWKGKHMIPILNQIGTNCAVVGNHDLDFGVDTLIQRSYESKFSWLLSNCIDNTTGEPLANAKEVEILEWGGLRIGLIGIVDPDWIATIGSVEPELLTVENFVLETNKLGKMLKTQKNCDLVFVLTHARWVVDEKLAAECDADYVDFIFGGHDHDYGQRDFDRVTSNGRASRLILLKSGSDFRDFSVVTLNLADEPSGEETGEVRKRRIYIKEAQIKRVTITREFPPDAETVKIIDSLRQNSDEQMENVLGEIDVDLDATFHSVRTEETRIANFMCDVMLSAVEADVALLNTGSLRADRVFPKGPFKMRDLQALLPFTDAILVLLVTGEELHQALENGVSKWPSDEGRFAAVSGLCYSFHSENPPGSRIDSSWITINGEPLSLHKQYRLCTTDFVADGKDGYVMLKKCKRILDEEEGPLLANIVMNYFESINVLEGKQKRLSFHHQSTVPRLLRHKIAGMEAAKNDKDKDVTDDARKKFKSKVRMVTYLRSLDVQKAVQDFEKSQHSCRIAPHIEGRISKRHNCTS